MIRGLNASLVYILLLYAFLIIKVTTYYNAYYLSHEMDELFYYNEKDIQQVN